MEYLDEYFDEENEENETILIISTYSSVNKIEKYYK
jgi:hypothetical protein